MVPQSRVMPERNPFRDEDSGKFTQGYTPDDALKALQELGGTATTGEVAEILGCARRTAYNKLVELEEQDRIDSRNPGRTRLWMLRGDDE